MLFCTVALLVALVVSFLMTPIVKTFAYKVGAIDVPKDARRMHKVPIPRLGGLAIFIGFMVSILLFVEITAEMRSILLGAVIIVVLGVVDDIMALPALLKFVVQIVAALVAVLSGNVLMPLLYHSFRPQSVYLWTIDCKRSGIQKMYESKLALYTALLNGDAPTAVRLTHERIARAIEALPLFGA